VPVLASETARVVAAKLPAIPVVRRVSQAVAMLDAVLMPEAWLRYYSFAADWNGSGWSLAQMRNGQGDDYLIAFTPEGAFIKGFAHDSAMSPWSFYPPHPWRGLTETVPTEFAACLHEPAFSMEDTTFCIWRRNQDPAWQTGFIAYPDSPYADGAGELLHLLVDPARPPTRHGRRTTTSAPVDLAAVARVYDLHLLTPSLVAALNPERALEELLPEQREIGYPSQ
jgi:hypothetical protein